MNANCPQRFCRFDISLACICHYSPRLGRTTKPRRAPRSGTLTPPRISPSCPHCVWLWLGRGTIVGEQGHCETACQSRFWMDGIRSAPYLAVFDGKKMLLPAGGPGASSASLPRLWAYSLMLFSCRIFSFQGSVKRLFKYPSLYSPQKRVFTSQFLKFFTKIWQSTV